MYTVYQILFNKHNIYSKLHIQFYQQIDITSMFYGSLF